MFSEVFVFSELHGGKNNDERGIPKRVALKGSEFKVCS